MAGQATIGVGGAFAALFSILTLGNTAHSSTTSDLTENPIYFTALCVVGGFVGNRLLVGVGERMAKQWADVDRKSTKAMDTAREAETKAENAEAIANQAKDMLVNTWIARDIADKVEKSNEKSPVVPEDLRTEAEAARAKLNGYREVFPTTRILFIVLANLTFALDHADEAVSNLNEFIANREKAGIKADEDDVSAWYNLCCYFSMLSAADPKSRGYSNKDTTERLQQRALQALRVCLEVAKTCGSQPLTQRLAKIKSDGDLKPIETLEGFRKLVDSYTGGQSS
jgi:hypothetical protein